MSLIVKNLTKTFHTPGGDVHALDNVSFSVNTGQFASIIGKSGSGKSTLLSLLGALDNPTSGEINVDDIKPCFYFQWLVGIENSKQDDGCECKRTALAPADLRLRIRQLV